FGKEIATAAERILNEVNNINYQTLAYKGHLVGKLKISIVSTAKYVMPYFLSGFLKAHPGIELQMEVTNKSQVLESLEENQVDFSLVSVLPTHLIIEKIELMQNKLFLVGNPSRKFKKTIYDKSIFEQLPLIYREPGSGTRYVMEKFINKNRLPVKKKMELATNEAVKQAVMAGLGYSIMPLIGIKNELINEDLQIIRVKGFPIKSVWSLIWLKGKSFSPASDAFLKYLRAEKEGIIKDRFDWFEKYT
ncbi:MAG: LysR family transcriptional regulator, partial [Bacteroidota bacterium]|nr:LysR family transcriptional regulator [Bacteroidota bacterium]